MGTRPCQILRLILQTAKTGGMAVTTLLLMQGITRAFVNIGRTAHHPEYLWTRDMTAPIAQFMERAVRCGSTVLASVATEGMLALLFAMRITFILNEDDALAEMGKSPRLRAVLW